MTNTNSPAEPTPSNPAAGTTAAASTGKPARKAPRRATAAAGAPLAKSSPAPALLVIDANGMIVPPPAVPAPESPATEEVAAPASLETFDAGSEPSADPAATDVLETDSELVEPETALATETAEPDTQDVVEAETPLNAGADTGTDTDTDTDDDTATSTQAIDDSVPDMGISDGDVSDKAVPGSDVADADVTDRDTPVIDSDVKETAPSDPTLSDATLADSGSNAASSAPTPAGEATGAESAATESDTTESDAAKSDNTESVAAESGAAAAPMSRRERRLAEQQGENGDAPVAALSAAENADRRNSISGDTDADADSQVAPSSAQPDPAKKSRPRTKRNRFVATIRGLFFLLVISALVVAMGTVLSGPEVDVNQDSPTQRQRQAAWEATTTLQASALTLAEKATTPAVRRELSTTATHLGIQAAALSNGMPSDGPATIAPPAASTIAELLQGLASNAESLLTNAQTAQSSMGRVFASVGTSQLLQAEQLGSATGATVPASAYLPAKVNFSVAAGPQCTSTLEPRPGVTVDSALSAAAVAEQKAVYAYQVATTRFAEPQFSESKALLTRHQEKLEVLNGELRLRCLPPAAPVAGFVLDADFTTLPKQALSTLESELGAIYSDLAAVSTENSTGVPAAAQATAAQTTIVETAAALTTASATDATQQPLNGSNLREISVLWLLDSIKSHTFWGGTIDALPGIDQNAATAMSSPSN